VPHSLSMADHALAPTSARSDGPRSGRLTEEPIGQRGGRGPGKRPNRPHAGVEQQEP
jgi:hypothetical protein